MQIKIIFFWLLTCSVAFGQESIQEVPELDNPKSSLQKEYNSLYSQTLIDKTLWPQQIEAQKQSVATASSAFDEASQALTQTESKIFGQVQALEAQKQHLDFLKLVEPRAKQEKQRIRQRVVAAGEFSAIADVTQSSLSLKAQDLNGQANSKQAEIDSNNGKIAEKKGTAEYQGYLNSRARLRRDLSDTKSQLSQTQNSLSFAESDLRSLEIRLRRSEDREEQARIRQVRIEQNEIPQEQREIQRLENDVRNLRLEIQSKRQARSQVEGRRDQTKAKLQNKKNQLSAEGADVPALQAEIRDLEARLRQQNQRIGRLTSQIQNHRSDIDRKQARISRKENNIRNLRNEARNQQTIASNESINQIRIEGDIRDKEREINGLQSDIVSLRRDIRSLEDQVARVQSQINQYIATHVRPIEAVIDGLQAEKSQLLARAGQLDQARQDLITQDQTVAQAQAKIPEQETAVKQGQAFVEAQKASVAQLKSEVTTTQAAQAAEIQTFNALISSIQQQRQQLADLQDQLIEAIQSQKNGSQ